MRLTVPVFIRRDETGRYKVSSLDLPEAQRQGASLEQAKALLARDLERAFAKAQVGALARLLSRPPVRLTTLDLLVELKPPGGKKEAVRGRFSVAIYPAPGALGGRIAIVPAVRPTLALHVLPGESLDERVQRALARWFEEDEAALVAAAIARAEWLHTLEVEVGGDVVADRFSPPKEGPGGASSKKRRTRDEVLRAETLLEVGVDLSAEAREGRLGRAFGREREAELVNRGLSGRDDVRAVLLVGEPGTGKTAIVHEIVRRRLKERADALASGEKLARHARATFTLGAGRLIAGMRYVGQWERRALDLAEEAEALDALLHIESLPEVIHAGRIHASDRTSVASLLAPRVASGAIAVIAETTPEGLRRAEEDDRSFTRLFQVVRIHEPPDERLLAILLEAVRGLEADTRAGFDVRSLRAAQDLLSRFVPYEAFPGKAIRLLRRLAEQARAHRWPAVTHGHVLSGFTTLFGVSYAMANDTTTIQRDAAEKWLSSRVKGQPEAVEALADVVVSMKSGMKDPEKPLASLLFVGPTGTGKTECAKALANYLFGSEERLLRFDLNEYSDSLAAERLVGSSWAPEGTLVRALRERPLAVVLLDEVEKADPGVLDLLLQLLGEGRITDALGRTADARNAVFVLTSNLGAERTGRVLGLKGGEEHERARWISAVEEFFRPELVNRFDRIVPFRALDAETLREIAAREVRALLDREGVKRRRLFLDLAPDLVERIVAEGSDAAMGARPLRRAAERRLAAPLAAALASRPAAESVLVRVTLPPGEAEARVTVEELRGLGRVEKGPPAAEVLPAPDMAHGAWARELAARFAALERSEPRRALRRALMEAAGVGSSSEEEDPRDHDREERMHRLEQELDLARTELTGFDMGRHRGGYVEQESWRWPPFRKGKPYRPEMTLAFDWTATPPPFVERLRAAALRIAKLERLVAGALEPAGRTLLHVTSLGDGSEHWSYELVSLYRYFFARYGPWPEDPADLPSQTGRKTQAIVVRFPSAHELLACEAGLHEVRYPNLQDRAFVARVRVVPLEPDEEAAAALARCESDAPLDAVSVVRKYVAGEFVHDVALGRSSPSSPDQSDEDDLHEEMRAAFHDLMIAGWLDRAWSAEERAMALEGGDGEGEGGPLEDGGPEPGLSRYFDEEGHDDLVER